MRRGGAWLIGGVAGLGLLLAVSLAALVFQSDRVLTAAVRHAGYPEADVTVDRLGWGEAELRLSLDRDGALQPGTVVLSWSLDSLLDQQLETVTLRGSRMRLAIGPDGRIAVPGLPAQETEKGSQKGNWAVGRIPVRHLAVRDGLVAVATPDGTVSFDLRLDLENHDGRLALDGELGGGAPPLAEGRVRLHAELAGSGPLTQEPWTGAFALSLQDGSWEGAVADATATLEGKVELAAGHLDIQSARSWTVEGRPTAPGLPAPLSEPLELVLAPLDDGPLHLWAEWSGEAPRFGWTGTVRAGTAAGVEIGSLSARDLRLVLQGRWPMVAQADSLLGELAPIAWGDARVGVSRFALDLAQTPLGAEGHVTVQASADGDLPGGVTVKEGNIAAAGRLGWSMEGLRFFPQGCVRLGAERLEVGKADLSQPVDLCLTAPEGMPMLDWLPSSTLRLDLASRDVPFDLSLTGGAGKPTRLDGRLPAVVARLEVDGGGLRAFDVDVADASIRFPDWQVAGHGVTARASYRLGRGKPLQVVLEHARVEDGRQPAWFAPLSLEGSADGSFQDAVGFHVASDQKPPLVVTGRHDFTTGSGTARLERLRLRFSPDGLTAEAVSPLLAQHVTDLSGQVAVAARLGWGPKAPADHAEVLLDDVSFAAGPVKLKGVNTVIDADSLMPLVIPPGQTVAIGLMDLGLPLTQGLVRFGLSDGRLSVLQAEWDWAGGKLRAEPFALSFPGLAGSIVLQADGLDLGKALELVAVEGLAGTGTLAGSLPIRLDADAVRVENGRLVAVGQGTLRYDPESPPSFLVGQEGSGTDILRKALANFHYESLALSVNGAAGGEMAVKLEIRGANPDLYNGYPVALNLNVSGALDTVLRRGLSAYHIPDAVRERMEEFQKTLQ